MSSLGNKFNWRIGYAFCCVIYVVWVVYLSLNNFDMVHGDFKRGGARLQPEKIRNIALKELGDQCRKELKRSGRLQSGGDQDSDMAEDLCSSWPADVLEERQKAVEARLVNDKHTGGRKLLVFYLFFGVFVLVLPPVILYWLISLLVWIFRSVKIER